MSPLYQVLSYLGSCCTARFDRICFATKANSGGIGSIFYGGHFEQLGKQAIAAGSVLVYSFVLTYIIGKLIDVTIGFRISEEDEVIGIDQVEHLETAYDYAGSSTGGSTILKEL